MAVPPLLSHAMVESFCRPPWWRAKLIFDLCRMKQKDASKLEDEYRRLVEGLAANEENVEDEDFMANPGTSLLFTRSMACWTSKPPELMLTMFDGRSPSARSAARSGAG